MPALLCLQNVTQSVISTAVAKSNKSSKDVILNIKNQSLLTLLPLLSSTPTIQFGVGSVHTCGRHSAYTENCDT